MSVQLLISAQLMISQFVGSSPASASMFKVQSLVGILFLLSLLLPAHSHTPSLKINKLKTYICICLVFSTSPFCYFFKPLFVCTHNDQQQTIIIKGFIFRNNVRDCMGRLSHFIASLGIHYITKIQGAPWWLSQLNV